MRLLTYSTAIVLLALLLMGCNALDRKVNSQAQNANATASPYSDGARRVTIAELEELIKDGKVFIVDVRGQDAYDVGHIPGAHMIAAGDIANHLKELPSDKLIVTYCS
jgi:3-mercaptopyruvate sulfurtransferase SseA